MASLADLEDALRNAHAAGDTDAAQQLADEIVRQRSAAGTTQVVPPVSAPASAPAAPVQDPSNPAAPQAGMSASDVLTSAAKNLLPSAGQFVKDMAQPVMHPIDTAQALGSVAGGVAAKMGIGNADQSAANAMGQFFANRYGGIENIKQTMAQDPVGFLSDLATVLSGGALAGERAPGVLGTMARATGAVGSAIDPMANVGRAVGGAGKVAGKLGSEVLGVTTGAGGDAIRGVAQAGYDGNKAALEQMRGTAPISDIRDSALYATDELTKDRAAQYNADMAPARADPTVLNFNGIDQALSDANDMVRFKGVVKNREGADVLNQMQSVVDDWKQLSPADYHTPAGFDALKQTLGGIRNSTDAGTPARKVADTVYRQVRDDIEGQVPSYAAAMRGYENASDQLNEIRRTLSLNENATQDTAIRKLLSTTRSNVNTNFGTRQNLVQQLAQKEPALPGMLAGRAMSSFMPTGLGRYALGAEGLGALASGGASIPGAMAALAASSPRIVGEGAYKMGQIGRGLNRLSPMQRQLLSRAMFQSGRTSAALGY